MRVVLILLAVLLATPAAAEWQPPEPTEAQMEVGRAAAAEYVEAYGQGRFAEFDDYSSTGEYLHYIGTNYRDGPNMRLDDAGVPMLQHSEMSRYSPVIVSQFTLASHARYINEREPIDALMAGADRLVAMQREDGALPYDFEWRHHLFQLHYRAGWFSGVAQGQALSAWARAYDVTGDERYLEAGEKALEFLQVRYPEGPMITLEGLDPSLADYIFFEEYIGSPPIITLNGYQFTLLGLYDWWQVTGSETARDLFERGIDSLLVLLPAFDIGTFTAYDLGHITHQGQPYQVERMPHVPHSYHAVHIYLLDVLHLVTGNEVLKRYADCWTHYVSPDEAAPSFQCPPRVQIAWNPPSWSGWLLVALGVALMPSGYATISRGERTAQRGKFAVQFLGYFALTLGLVLVVWATLQIWTFSGTPPAELLLLG